MNSTVALLRYAHIEGKGWRRGAAVLGRNGKLKADTMVFGGREIHCPNGRWQMRRLEGDRPIYTNLGTDAADAVHRFKAEQSKLKAKVAAVTAGIEIVADDDPSRKTLKQYRKEFLAMHRSLPHRSDDSVRVYEQITSSFLQVCKAVMPEKITKSDVIAWHGHLRNELKYSDRTAADRYKSLRGFLKYCGVNPAAIIPQGTHKLLKAYTKKRVNNYTPEVVAALIAASTDSNRALLWDFAYKTGLRDSELQMLTRHDLHGLETSEPTVHIKERDGLGRIKDAEERVVELHPSLVPALKLWLKQNPDKRLLFGTVNDKPDSKMLLALKATARRAGLNCGQCKGCKGKNNECAEFTLHRFRRTYVTRMLRATGGDLRSVMQRSGHSDLTSVMRYLEPAAHIREAVAAAF